MKTLKDLEKELNGDDTNCEVWLEDFRQARTREFNKLVSVDELRASAIEDAKKSNDLTFKAPELLTIDEKNLIRAYGYIMEKFNLTEEDLK